MNRQVNLKDVIEIIDSKIEELKTQNGMGALMVMSGWVNSDKLNRTIDSNKTVIKELTDLRMKVLEI